MFSLFKLFENKENAFSYENKTKTNFENKENEFTIFNILYINQKTVMCCFSCFRIIRIQKCVKQNQIISEKKSVKQ